MANVHPYRRGRIIASVALVAALAGGLWWFASSPDAEPVVDIATSCSQFAADAQKLFDKSGTTVLKGTFAPGDHLHLAADLNGVGSSWELTGVLAKKPVVEGSGPITLTTISTADSTVSRGRIKGAVRFDLDVDIAAAGEGAISMTTPGTALVPPKLVSASCKAAKKPSARAIQANPGSTTVAGTR